MSKNTGQSNPAYALFMMDMVNGLLHRAGDLQEVADHLTEQLREITGARTVILLRSMPTESGEAYKVVSVNPQRRRFIAESSESAALFTLCAELTQAVLWRAGEDSPMASVIETLDCDLAAAVPLRVDNNYIGCILALDLPDDRQGSVVAPYLDTLASVVALVLHNAFLIEQQDNVIEARTAELRDSELLLNQSQEIAHVGSWKLDLVDNRLIWSDEVYRIFGLTPQEFEATYETFMEAVHPDDRTMVDDAYKRSVQDGRDRYEIEHRVVQKDTGRIRHVREECRHIRDASGKVVRSVGMVQDITDRKHAWEEREELEAQLRQAQKMEAVGQLAGGIAHDFNNLLQAILGYGEMARGETEDGSPIRGFIGEVLKAGDRAKTLVSQLLAFSRRQVLEMEDLDLNEVIADLMKMIRRVIGEHLTLDILPGHDLGIVRVDRGQIGQILTNLCVNARDAMSEGGTIVIESENVRIDQEYCESHSWAKPGRYVLLSVTDSGCGMDKETLDRVFEPFFTTKGLGKGTGLGLSTVYGLVKQHEGHVDIYSEVEKGTRFKIYLPMIERSAAVIEDEIEGPIPVGTETILLAEDDEMVLKLSRSVLTHAGYTVFTAADGEQAMEVFDEHGDEIDLALLDVVMPKLGGRAVFEKIRAKRPELPVLFSSGYSMNAIHTNFVLDEGLTLIQKPYQRADLLRKVRETLDRK
jgi:PAS domain S-box-containing protein